MSKRTSTWLGIALCLAISLTVGAPAVATDPDAKGVLTGTAWEYIKVPQKEFEKLEPSQFSDLAVFANRY